MPEYLYSGFYARFDTPDKTTGSMLMGPDNIVGDEFFINFKTEDGITKAWIDNKFEHEIGFFGIDTSRKLQLAQARNLKIKLILSFVAYTDNPDPGHYWGEMAVFCYSPAHEKEFNLFVDRCSIKISDGVRPNIDLGSQGISNILSNETWLPKETVPFPKKETGFAVLKDHRSVSEKMIEQGRSKNIGCYIVSWVFIAIVMISLCYLLYSLIFS